MNKPGLAISKIDEAAPVDPEDQEEASSESMLSEEFDERQHALMQDLINSNNRESSDDDFKDF